ncbi:protein TsetseEP, partial [Austrofundulus limnaeus]|uniref:Protein TsetseEP n=1 Tax=Austrofundulus limnaeus TaxID=52670 RepID=A0A2I4DCX6_AUSLI
MEPKDMISAALRASLSTLLDSPRSTPSPTPSRCDPVLRFFVRPRSAYRRKVYPPTPPFTPEESPSPSLLEFELLEQLCMEDDQPSEESLRFSDSSISSVDTHTPQELRDITPDEEPLSEPAPPPTPAPPPRRRSRLPVSIRRLLKRPVPEPAAAVEPRRRSRLPFSIRRLLKRPVPGPAAAVEPDEKPLSEMEDSQPLGESLSSSDSSISTIDTHTPQELRDIPLITTPDEEPLSEPAPPPTPAPPPRRRSRLPVSVRRLQRPVPGPA